MSEHPPPQPPSVPAAQTVIEPAGRAASPPTRTLAGTIVLLVVFVIAAAIALRGHTATTAHYVGLSMLLFVTGALGVLVRRNALVMFMCVELMLNATNLAFVAFARMHGSVDGHVIVLFVIIVAAAEVAVGLAIIVSIFRRRHSTNVDDLSLLRG